MEDIRIQNIENYVWSFVNGDLLLTSKRVSLSSGQAEEHAAMYAAEADESSGKAEEHAAMYAAEASESSTEQVHYVSKEELIASATDWKIQNCLIRSGDTVISTSLANQTIVKDIWRTMPRNKIIEDRPHPKTYTFIPEDTDLNSCKEHDLYFHSVNNKKSIREILHLVKNNQLTIQLTILTKQGDLIHYKA
jgi:hypothetical protein